MREINYIGKIVINTSLEFSYANLSFMVKQVSSDSPNIYGGKITKIKGWQKNCIVDIFLTNKTSESANFSSLMTNLKQMGKGGATILIEGYSEDGNTVVFSELFDILDSEINYSDYFSNNSKLGIKFSFSVIQSTITDTIPCVWQDTQDIYILSDDILIEDYTVL